MNWLSLLRLEKIYLTWPRLTRFHYNRYRTLKGIWSCQYPKTMIRNPKYIQRIHIIDVYVPSESALMGNIRTETLITACDWWHQQKQKHHSHSYTAQISCASLLMDHYIWNDRRLCTVSMNHYNWNGKTHRRQDNQFDNNNIILYSLFFIYLHSLISRCCYGR